MPDRPCHNRSDDLIGLSPPEEAYGRTPLNGFGSPPSPPRQNEAKDVEKQDTFILFP
jgi:hypothetical protein